MASALCPVTMKTWPFQLFVRCVRQRTQTEPSGGLCWSAASPYSSQFRAPRRLKSCGSSGAPAAMQCATKRPHQGTSSPGYHWSRFRAQPMIVGLSAAPGSSRVPSRRRASVSQGGSLPTDFGAGAGLASAENSRDRVSGPG